MRENLKLLESYKLKNLNTGLSGNGINRKEEKSEIQLNYICLSDTAKLGISGNGRTVNSYEIGGFEIELD